MLRGRRIFRAAQHALVAISAIMIVSMVVMAMLYEEPADWGVTWSEPAYISLDSIEVDREGRALVLTIHLWDSEDRATEWDGRLGLSLMDENLVPVLETERTVRSGDFTTVKVDGWIDTYYVLAVPFEHMAHVTDRMVAHPNGDISALVTFDTGEQVLTEEFRWWPEPTYVKVETYYVDTKYRSIEYDVWLFDDTWNTTKRSGDLRIIIHDSLGQEMYNRSVPVQAREFNLLDFGGREWTWYRGWVVFDDVRRSTDRIEGDNDSGRRMRVLAWFDHGGEVLKQDPEGFTALKNTKPIPDDLLLENRPPEARLVADRWGREDTAHQFNASGTRDDLGTEGLLYEWSWGDGTLTETTASPMAKHTFTRAGSFDVELRVTDVEGASSVTSTTVDVLQDPRVEPDEIGKGEVVGKAVHSYPMARLKELMRDGRGLRTDD